MTQCLAIGEKPLDPPVLASASVPSPMPDLPPLPPVEPMTEQEPAPSISPPTATGVPKTPAGIPPSGLFATSPLPKPIVQQTDEETAL